MTQPWLHSSQPHTTDSQPQDAEEAAVKAPQDATIAAIGFVAVLIVNVAYVGVLQQDYQLCRTLRNTCQGQSLGVVLQLDEYMFPCSNS